MSLKIVFDTEEQNVPAYFQKKCALDFKENIQEDR